MLEKMKIGSSIRIFLFVIGALICAGIWLTGYKNVHWLLYVPAAFLLLAAVTGYCPGMMFSRMATGDK
jgi:hypothetical protein